MTFPTLAQLFPVGSLGPAFAKTYFADTLTTLRTLLGDGSDAKVSRDTLGVAMHNWLINPDGAIIQRALGAKADDVYMDDRWYGLTQTSTITPSQLVNPEDGFKYGLRLTQSQAVAQRLGRAQIMEGKDTMQLRGKTVTFGGRFRSSSAQVLRYAILAWSGAEDVVVSDFVNNWANATYTPGQFFNATTLAVVGVGSTALAAATPTSCSVGGVVPSNANNLAVFYWYEGTAAQNVTLDAWGLRLVEASMLVDYLKRSYADEFWRCLRFYQKNFIHCGAVPSSNTIDFTVILPAQMRATGSLVYDDTVGNIGKVKTSVATNVTISAGGGSNQVDRFQMNAIVSGSPYWAEFNYYLDAEL